MSKLKKKKKGLTEFNKLTLAIVSRADYRRTRLDVGNELGSFYNNPGKDEGGLDQGGSCGGDKRRPAFAYNLKVSPKICWRAECGM